MVWLCAEKACAMCNAGAFSPEAVINRALIGAAHYTNEQQHTLAHYCVDCAHVFLAAARFEVDVLRWVVQIGVDARRRSSSPAHFQERSERFCHWSASLHSYLFAITRAEHLLCVRGAAALSAEMCVCRRRARLLYVNIREHTLACI